MFFFLKQICVFNHEKVPDNMRSGRETEGPILISILDLLLVSLLLSDKNLRTGLLSVRKSQNMKKLINQKKSQIEAKQ